jgi:hypothetical protein
MRKLNRLPAEGTKDRAKLEAMLRTATQRELEDIDGNGGWGTYKNDGERYADFLGGELKIRDSGPRRRYRVVMPASSATTVPDRSRLPVGSNAPRSAAPVVTSPMTTARRHTARAVTSAGRVPLSNRSAVLSIVGWHAGESVEDIIERKRTDIGRAGRTVWLYQSWKASIPTIQQFGRAFPNPAVIFLEGSAFPTSAASPAREMSVNSDGRIQG